MLEMELLGIESEVTSEKGSSDGDVRWDLDRDTSQLTPLSKQTLTKNRCSFLLPVSIFA